MTARKWVGILAHVGTGKPRQEKDWRSLYFEALTKIPETDRAANGLDDRPEKPYDPPDPATAVDWYNGLDPKDVDGLLSDYASLVPITAVQYAFVSVMWCPPWCRPLANALVRAAGAVEERNYAKMHRAAATTIIRAPKRDEEPITVRFERNGRSVHARMLSQPQHLLQRWADAPGRVVVVLEHRGDIVDLSKLAEPVPDSDVVALVVNRPALRMPLPLINFGPLTFPVVAVQSGMPPLALAARVAEALPSVRVVVAFEGDVSTAREPDFAFAVTSGSSP